MARQVVFRLFFPGAGMLGMWQVCLGCHRFCVGWRAQFFLQECEVQVLLCSAADLVFPCLPPLYNFFNCMLVSLGGERWSASPLELNEFVTRHNWTLF